MTQKAYEMFIGAAIKKIDDLIKNRTINPTAPDNDWKYDLAMDAYVHHFESGTPLSEAIISVYHSRMNKKRVYTNGKRYRAYEFPLSEVIRECAEGWETPNKLKDCCSEVLHLLTPEESIVLGMLVDGYIQAQIADTVGHSQATVSRRIKSITEKVKKYREENPDAFKTM